MAQRHVIELTDDAEPNRVRIRGYNHGERQDIRVTNATKPLVIGLAAREGGTGQAVDAKYTLPGTPVSGTPNAYDFTLRFPDVNSVAGENQTVYFNIWEFDANDEGLEGELRAYGQLPIGPSIYVGRTALFPAQVITALVPPDLALATDADTPLSAFTSGTYSSTAGTVSVTTVYRVNGASVTGSSTLTAGQSLEVTQTVTDDDSNIRSFSVGPVTIKPSQALSNVLAPTISGIPNVGSALAVSAGAWSGSAARSYSYQWLRDGENIAGATSNTYTLVDADNETDVSCRVTATDGVTSISATTATVAVTVVDNTPPELGFTTLEARSYGVDTGLRYYNVIAEGNATGPDGSTCFMKPVIMSVTALDQGSGSYAVRALTGGYPEPSYAYQWKLDGESISGEDEATIDASGLEGDLSVQVTATNQWGVAVSTSAAITIASSVTPTHIGSIASSTSGASAVGSWQPTSPAYSAGDLVILNHAADHGAISVSLTAPNGETVTKTVTDVDSGDNAVGDVTQTIFWYIATAGRAEGEHMTVTPSANDYFAGTVTVFDAGTFNTSTPLGDVATSISSGLVDPVTFPTATSTATTGIVLRLGVADEKQFTIPVTDHENGVESSSGVTSAMAATRTAPIASGESAGTATSALIGGADRWVATTLIVRGA